MAPMDQSPSAPIDQSPSAPAPHSSAAQDPPSAAAQATPSATTQVPPSATATAPVDGSTDLVARNNINQPIAALVNALLQGYNILDDLPKPDKLTGETWTIKFQCEGADPENEFVELEVDKAYVNYYNVGFIKSKFGYSGRDFLFYKKRCGRDLASLVELLYDNQTDAMILANEREKVVRVLCTQSQPKSLEVNVTPLKRPRRRHSEVPIDAYKQWLSRMRHEDQDTDYHDEYRDETIATYREWLRQEGLLRHILTYNESNANDDERLSDEENDGTNQSPIVWPSHARRQRKNATGGALKKEGRGTLKGISAALKRIKAGEQKLKIQFSSRLGGAIGPNARAFTDEVVLFMKKRAPLIGVEKWKDIDPSVKNSIASDILERWEIPSNFDEKEKIWGIAKERYRGWRSTLSATYKAYNNYDARMRHKPEEIDIVEWHYMNLYFNSEKFQNISRKNSDNRKKQKTKHFMGSRTISQTSYDQRDPETGEEPSDLNLWMATHTKNGEWSNSASKEVYDKGLETIMHTQADADAWLTTEEENAIFQKQYNEITGSKSRKPHGHGYLSKYKPQSESMTDKLIEQARANAATNQKNIELQGEVDDLKEKLAKETAERERIEEKMKQLQEDEERKREASIQKLREEMFSKFGNQSECTLQQTTPTNSILADTLAATPSKLKKDCNNQSGTNGCTLEQNNSTSIPTDPPAETPGKSYNARATRSSTKAAALEQNNAASIPNGTPAETPMKSKNGHNKRAGTKGVKSVVNNNTPAIFIASHNLRNSVTKRVLAKSQVTDEMLGSDMET